MDFAGSAYVPSAPAHRRAPKVPSSVVGMLIFVVTEVMFFAGCISAFTIVRAGTPAWNWPPPNQPRLPAASTLFNSGLLLLSGVLLAVAFFRYRAKKDALAALLAAWSTGACFVVLQGNEWLRLLAQGLTLTSSPLGSFFYLIVGAHALHAIVALSVLATACVKLSRRTLTPAFFFATQTFWYFVVLVWPVIYLRVYF